MRFHRTLPKIAKECYHGININKPCVKCIEYFINDHQTSIRLLKQQLKIIKKHELKITKRGRKK